MTIDRTPPQIGAITRAMKKLSKELHVPVVALSQLNRASETGQKVERRRPTLTDLRDSGDIEQDADVVMFLHQPDPEQQPSNVLGLVAKNRDGALGEVPLSTDRATSPAYSQPKGTDKPPCPSQSPA